MTYIHCYLSTRRRKLRKRKDDVSHQEIINLGIICYILTVLTLYIFLLIADPSNFLEKENNERKRNRDTVQIWHVID